MARMFGRGDLGGLPPGVSRVQGGATMTVAPLREGYLRKGGLMGPTQIAERPAPPPAFKPATGSGGGSNQGGSQGGGNQGGGGQSAGTKRE